MCRSIKRLRAGAEVVPDDEIREAALQYVRKVSGLSKPPQADEAAFATAIDAVTAATTTLLAALTSRGHVRTREGEREKAQRRWQMRRP